MKLSYLLYIAFYCLNFACFSQPVADFSQEGNADWSELAGNWKIFDESISPDSSGKQDSQSALIRNEMAMDTRWAGMQVKFQIDTNSSLSATGFVLNAKDASEFGILRISNTSGLFTLQVGRWEFGRYRPHLNVGIKEILLPEKWYCLEVYPTTDRKEWRPWTITLRSCEDRETLLTQGIGNEMALFGRGITGIYARGSACFRDFHVDIISNPSCRGNLRLAPSMATGMVMQRNTSVPVWGKTLPGENVQVEINNSVFRVCSDSAGYWQVDLPPMDAKDSLDMLVISSSDSILIQNIAIGEVWLASGQSNMQMKVWQTDMDSIAKRLPPDNGIRMFIQPHWPSEFPVFDSGGKWEFSDPEITQNWSAVAFSFALRLREKLNVPVGIIGSYWGGTAAESWMPREELEGDSMTKNIMDQYIRAQLALRSGQPVTNVHPWNVPGQSHAPGYLFNGMIHPHIPAAIKGVIWNQGGSNARRAKQYETLFPMLIRSWRKAWNAPDLYFFFVQLPGYDGKESGSNIEHAWPQLRDAQRITSQGLGGTGMAVTIDLGHKTDIHSKQKKEIGERLARLALHDAYGFNDIVRSSPLFENVVFKEDTAIVLFSETAMGLKATDGQRLQGFIVAGDDQKFYPANAKIASDGKRVQVWSDKVIRPVAVRYAWENFPDNANLCNSAELPASPFRSDSWALPTDSNR